MDWDDVRTVAMTFPDVTEEGETGGEALRSWRVRAALLAWERPLRRADLEALGPDAPTGPILGIRTVDLTSKEELLLAAPAVFFTTPHFASHPAVLARLPALDVATFTHLFREVWLDRAPKRTVRAYLAGAG
jgi:hypothetical protein